MTGDTQPPEDTRRASPLDQAPLEEAGRPGLVAVRAEERLYVEYETGESELYDLREDPYQLENRHEAADPDLVQYAERRLEALRGCVGAACRTAEDGH